MKPDINKYLPMLNDMDLSREQKIELIHDLWHIMQNFVDRAFGVHPLQQCRDKKEFSDLHDSTKCIESIPSPQPSDGDIRP